jgi:hypothetical protein
LEWDVLKNFDPAAYIFFFLVGAPNASTLHLH